MENLKNAKNELEKSQPINQFCFEENTLEQSFLFYSGISFGLLADNAIMQRTEDYMPLDILAISASVNFHLSCDFLLKFVLSKFNRPIKHEATLTEMFLGLPKLVQNQILENINVDTKYVSVLPNLKNLDFYEQNKKDILQIFHFFNTFQKRIEAVAMDIEQNNFFM